LNFYYSHKIGLALRKLVEGAHQPKRRKSADTSATRRTPATKRDFLVRENNDALSCFECAAAQIKAISPHGAPEAM
jgi:hypothetical protein